MTENDQRLKNIEALLETFGGRFDQMDRRFDRVVELVVSVKESLEREIHGLHGRLDAQGHRIDAHSSLLLTGSRWSHRMNTRTERLDALLQKHSDRLAEQNTRITKLEHPELGTLGKSPAEPPAEPPK